ncbi:MAG: toprim domain-containing protein, partial [bacterium]|nr:toprim domain-containing protein [bacterium]
IPRDTVEGFFLGYCPHQDSGLKNYLMEKGFKVPELEAFQIFKGSREFFRGRLIFPIFRGDKKVVGFGGRKLSERDHGPKYLNSPESELFKKGDLVYGLDRAKAAIRQGGQIILVEGYFDVLALHAHGFDHAVAPLGTALTQNQARTLHRLAEDIILAFDGDDAGQKAALRALEVLLGQGNLPRSLRLEPGEDPDSFLRQQGRLVMEKKLAATRNLLEELIDKWSAQAQGPHVSLGAKGELAGQLLTIIEKIPNPITRNLYLRRLAESLEMPEEWLHRGNRRAPTPAATQNPRERPHWLPEEETILEIWLKFGGLRPHICESLQPDDFCTENVRTLARAFWDLAGKKPQVSTGKYFDLAPMGLLEVLSELAIRSNGLEEESTAKQTLEQACLRLKEKRLRMDLQDLKRSAAPEQITLIQKKIDALSQVIKDKARSYGQG